MSVKYMVGEISRVLGLKSSQRDVAIRWINKAAREVWNATDLNGCLQECIVEVNSQYEIALPSFVGTVRAVREFHMKSTFSVLDMRPRYHNTQWVKEWDAWRDKGKAALMVDFLDVSKMHFSVAAVETPNVELQVVGKTPNSARFVETVTLSTAGTCLTTGTYESIIAITKSSKNIYDITVLNDDGAIVAVIPNDQLSSQYTILDVSNYPWTIPSQAGSVTCMEVLYKQRLPELSDDEDEFPIPDCDDGVVDRALAIFYSEQPEKAELAIAYDAKSRRTLQESSDSRGQGKTKTIEFVRHGHDNLFIAGSGGSLTHKQVC